MAARLSCFGAGQGLWLLVLFASECLSLTQLYGVGGFLPSQLYTDAFLAYRFIDSGVRLTYSATSSLDGFCRLQNDVSNCSADGNPILLDFASSDQALPSANQLPDLQLYPTVASAVVIVYNLEGLCPGLVLSPETLVQIFRGEVTWWDDPQITEHNPNCSLPANAAIQVVVRSDPGGITDILTKALNSFDSAQMPGSGPVWDEANANVVQCEGNQGVVAYVALNPLSLGYTSLAFARRNQMATVRLWRYGEAQEASAEGVGFAVLEQGLLSSMGTSLTADLQGAQCKLAWPIAGYSYLVMRKGWRRAGTSCSDVAAMAKFWQWFWTSDVVGTLADGLGFTSLPSVVRDLVLSRFSSDITCDGAVVYTGDDVSSIRVSGVGPASVSHFFDKLPPVYGLVNPRVVLSYSNAPSVPPDVEELLQSSTYVVTRSSIRPEVTDGATLTLSAVGFAIVSRYRVTLDGETLARILEGEITMWQHPDLQALNPLGIFNEKNESLSNRSMPITIVPSPVFFSSSWQRLMQKYLPRYTGAAAQAAGTLPTYAAVQSVVSGTRGSLSAIALVGQLAQGVQAASFQRLDGNVVPLSWQNVQACASPDVYQPDEVGFVLQDSQSPLCYPLTEALYLTLKKPSCDFEHELDVTRSETASFVEWLFNSQELDASLQEQNLAPLQAVSLVSVQANQRSLDYVACRRTSSHWTLSQALPIVSPVLGFLLVLLMAGAGAFWVMRLRMRTVRQRHAADLVALGCAEELMRLDFPALEWLDHLAQPDPVLLMLRRIAHLLRGVKPYVPDALFEALPHLDDSQSQSIPEDGPEDLPDPGPTDTELMEEGGTTSHDRLDPGQFSSILTEPCGVVPSGDASHCRRVHWTGRPTPRALLHEPSRRHCSCLAARFDLDDDGSLCPQEALQHAMALATHLLQVGKGANAMVDRVTTNSIVLFWGMDGSGAHTLQAVKAALEMAEAARVLPPRLQPILKLQIGVGQGLCLTATLCFAGHRFSVVSGREAALPVELIAADQPSCCGCSILLTTEVHQKVQYWVQCHPRVLFNKVLLWEPVHMSNSDKAPGEWMYVLQHLQSTQCCRLSGDALERPFRLAEEGAPWEQVGQEVASIKEQFASELSAQDVRALNTLLNSLEPAHRRE